VVEIGSGLSYVASRITGRQYHSTPTKQSFGQAFGVERYAQVGGNVYVTTHAPHMSYDETVPLTPNRATPPDLSRLRSPEKGYGHSREDSLPTLLTNP
jgi:hypothetical protein